MDQSQIIKEILDTIEKTCEKHSNNCYCSKVFQKLALLGDDILPDGFTQHVVTWVVTNKSIFDVLSVLKINKLIHEQNISCLLWMELYLYHEKIPNNKNTYVHDIIVSCCDMIPYEVLKNFNSDILSDICNSIEKKDNFFDSNFKLNLLRVCCCCKTQQLFNLLTQKYHITPDCVCLENAVLNDNIDCINKISMEYKVPFSDICLEHICQIGNLSVIESILKQGIQLKYEHFLTYVKGVKSQDFLEKFINLITSHKYELTKQHIIDVIKYGTTNQLYIPNIEKFGLVCDGDIIKVCNEFYNFCYKETYTIEALRKICTFKSTTVKTIKPFVSNDIIPDIICLRNICSIDKKMIVIKYLLKYVDLDMTCILNSYNAVKGKWYMHTHENTIIMMINMYIQIHGNNYSHDDVIVLQNIHKNEPYGYRYKSQNQYYSLIDMYIENNMNKTKNVKKKNMKQINK